MKLIFILELEESECCKIRNKHRFLGRPEVGNQDRPDFASVAQKGLYNICSATCLTSSSLLRARVRVSHVSMVSKNLLDLFLAGVMWWSFGWGIAFGVGTEDGKFNQFVGPGSFFASGDEFGTDGYYSTTEGYNWALWLFQVLYHTTAVCAAATAAAALWSVHTYIYG